MQQTENLFWRSAVWFYLEQKAVSCLLSTVSLLWRKIIAGVGEAFSENRPELAVNMAYCRLERSFPDKITFLMNRVGIA